MRDVVLHWHRSTRTFAVYRRGGGEIMRTADYDEALQVAEAEQGDIDARRAAKAERDHENRFRRAARPRRTLPMAAISRNATGGHG